MHNIVNYDILILCSSSYAHRPLSTATDVSPDAMFSYFQGYTSHPLMLVTEFMPLGSLTEVLRNPVIKGRLVLPGFLACSFLC